MDINLLVNITSRAWCLTILRLMNDGVPGRQAPLIAASGASRTSFANSLALLVNLGLLERNPGHGHPLRPEYRLTAQGVKFAILAKAIANAFPDTDEPPLLRRAWTIPILAVSHKPRRFIEIKTDLMPVTDRALSQSLQNLETKHWLIRSVNVNAHPIRPVYQTVNQGVCISDAIRQII